MKDNVFDGIFSFKGKWRNYQARVLDESHRYLQDGKLHIVAAPGAGKTTLGIELILRCKSPCLILSPRIVIREQWLERIRDSFLCAGKEADSYLSNDIRHPRLITSITYQTLFCQITGAIDSEGQEESADYSDPDDTLYAQKLSGVQTGQDFQEPEKAAGLSGLEFIKHVKDAGIRTVCLDECHHLKNEWWKSLEKFMAKMNDITVISLTATPPYDSSPAQWERYTKICGSIDTEITIPELVKEGSLCPHQDYVWFNCPTAEEEQQLHHFRKGADEMYQMLMSDAALMSAARSHRALSDYDTHYDTMLEKPEYLSALLIYCQTKGIPFSKKWLEVLGVKTLPPMTEKWMGYFLQGFLYEDAESYTCQKEYREILIKDLKANGILEQKKVSFLMNSKMEKLLINSSGKMDSILKIAACEHTAMGTGLRMLILTDYIRKEYRSSLGDPSKELRVLGVVPVFELLRRRGAAWKLGVLCGSMIFLPDTAVKAFKEEVNAHRESPDISVRKLTASDGSALGYSEVIIQGRLHLFTKVMTELFERGEVQILIGTKSLLGEGWDSPCINSLIMASFVGSYVLGNQMRGRAIRTFANAPDKVSNIWHLVCVAGQQERKENRVAGAEHPELSEDFHTLKRRMDGIMGLSYDGATIESGMERLSTIKAPFTKAHVNRMNHETAERCVQRQHVAEQWQRAVCIYENLDAVEECTARRRDLKPGASFYYTLGAEIMFILAEAATILYRATQSSSSMLRDNFPVFIISVLFIIFTFYFAGKLLRNITPMKRYRSISQGVLTALKRDGQILSDCKVAVREEEGVSFSSWLEGGTYREKSLFADSLSQMLAPIDNQRYLLCFGKRGHKVREFFCVPQVFAGTREKASLFARTMETYIGKYTLVYTRNPEGRRLLLEARAKAFSNKNERLTDRRKKIKGALE